MKGYSTFPKVPALLEPHHQIVYCHIQDTRCGGSYPSAEKQPVYSTAPADWAMKRFHFTASSMTEGIFIDVHLFQTIIVLQILLQAIKLLVCSVHVSFRPLSSLGFFRCTMHFRKETDPCLVYFFECTTKAVSNIFTWNYSQIL